MAQFLIFFTYFSFMLLHYNDMPKWLVVIIVICTIFSILASIFLLEMHKEKIQELKDKIDKLEDYKNE